MVGQDLYAHLQAQVPGSWRQKKCIMQTRTARTRRISLRDKAVYTNSSKGMPRGSGRSEGMELNAVSVVVPACIKIWGDAWRLQPLGTLLIFENLDCSMHVTRPDLASGAAMPRLGVNGDESMPWKASGTSIVLNRLHTSLNEYESNLFYYTCPKTPMTRRIKRNRNSCVMRTECMGIIDGTATSFQYSMSYRLAMTSATFHPFRFLQNFSCMSNHEAVVSTAGHGIAKIGWMGTRAPSLLAISGSACEAVSTGRGDDIHRKASVSAGIEPSPSSFSYQVRC